MVISHILFDLPSNLLDFFIPLKDFDQRIHLFLRTFTFLSRIFTIYSLYTRSSVNSNSSILRTCSSLSSTSEATRSGTHCECDSCLLTRQACSPMSLIWEMFQSIHWEFILNLSTCNPYKYVSRVLYSSLFQVYFFVKTLVCMRYLCNIKGVKQIKKR